MIFALSFLLLKHSGQDEEFPKKVSKKFHFPRSTAHDLRLSAVIEN